jgi:putative membrane protein
MASRASMLTVALITLPVWVVAKAATPDESFYKDAAEGGLAEVAAGQLAQSKASAQDVKDFAAMMVKDHSAANAKLKRIATTKGVELPTEPGIKHKAMKKKMEMKSGSGFDQDYIEGQINDHKATVDLLQKEIDKGQDSEAKAFATETLPVVRQHLEKIQQIASAHGVK